MLEKPSELPIDREALVGIPFRLLIVVIALLLIVPAALSGYTSVSGSYIENSTQDRLSDMEVGIRQVYSQGNRAKITKTINFKKTWTTGVEYVKFGDELNGSKAHTMRYKIMNQENYDTVVIEDPNIPITGPDNEPFRVGSGYHKLQAVHIVPEKGSDFVVIKRPNDEIDMEEFPSVTFNADTPDLAVSYDGIVSNSRITEVNEDGPDKWDFNITIWNKGDVETGEFNVTILKDPEDGEKKSLLNTTDTDEDPLDSIPPGEKTYLEKKEVDMDYNDTLEVKVDPTDTIMEQSGKNNQASFVYEDLPRIYINSTTPSDSLAKLHLTDYFANGEHRLLQPNKSLSYNEIKNRYKPDISIVIGGPKVNPLADWLNEFTLKKGWGLITQRGHSKILWEGDYYSLPYHGITGSISKDGTKYIMIYGIKFSGTIRGTKQFLDNTDSFINQNKSNIVYAQDIQNYISTWERYWRTIEENINIYKDKLADRYISILEKLQEYRRLSYKLREIGENQKQRLENYWRDAIIEFGISLGLDQINDKITDGLLKRVDLGKNVPDFAKMLQEGHSISYMKLKYLLQTDTMKKKIIKKAIGKTVMPEIMGKVEKTLINSGIDGLTGNPRSKFCNKLQREFEKTFTQYKFMDENNLTYINERLRDNEEDEARTKLTNSVREFKILRLLKVQSNLEKLTNPKIYLIALNSTPSVINRIETIVSKKIASIKAVPANALPGFKKLQYPSNNNFSSNVKLNSQLNKLSTLIKGEKGYLEFLKSVKDQVDFVTSIFNIIMEIIGILISVLSGGVLAILAQSILFWSQKIVENRVAQFKSNYADWPKKIDKKISKMTKGIYSYVKDKSHLIIWRFMRNIFKWPKNLLKNVNELKNLNNNQITFSTGKHTYHYGEKIHLNMNGVPKEWKINSNKMRVGIRGGKLGKEKLSLVHIINKTRGSNYISTKNFTGLDLHSFTMSESDATHDGEYWSRSKAIYGEKVNLNLFTQVKIGDSWITISNSNNVKTIRIKPPSYPVQIFRYKYCNGDAFYYDDGSYWKANDIWALDHLCFKYSKEYKQNFDMNKIYFKHYEKRGGGFYGEGFTPIDYTRVKKFSAYQPNPSTDFDNWYTFEDDSIRSDSLHYFYMKGGLEMIHNGNILYDFNLNKLRWHDNAVPGDNPPVKSFYLSANGYNTILHFTEDGYSQYDPLAPPQPP